jgi:histidine phosphotransferase ChpT
MSGFDLRLAEMLASRLCHDLVNPLGAVANGIELMGEFCDTMQKDALDLVGTSAERAMKRIGFFRVAYGSAGHDEGQSVSDIRPLAEGFLAGGKITLDWPARPEDMVTELPRSGLKLLLCLIALGAECLPRGGRLVVSMAAPGEAQVTAEGQGARLDVATEAVLAAIRAGDSPDPDLLEPKCVGAAYAGRLARIIGARLDIEAGSDRVDLRLGLGLA